MNAYWWVTLGAVVWLALVFLFAGLCGFNNIEDD